MKITDIVVRKINEDQKLKAIVSVTFDNMFVVHDIKVIQGDQGVFLAMPSKKISEGRFKDIAHPINAEMRSILEAAVLEAVEQKQEELRNENN